MLLNDRLPTTAERDDFQAYLAARREIGDEVHAVLRQAANEDKPAMDALRMGAATANLDAEADNPQSTALRLVAVFPTIVAAYWRYRQGNKPVGPRDDLRHAANYLYMLTSDESSDAAVQGIETYLNTVIDHGLNASTRS